MRAVCLSRTRVTFQLCMMFWSLCISTRSQSQAPKTPPAEAPEGMRECPDCSAKGLRSCPACRGKKKTPQACPRCSGTGEMHCAEPKCVEGRKGCRQCNGARTVKVVDHFDETRVGTAVKRPRGTPVYRDDRCPTCKGVGTTTCTTCGGDGKERCLECHGTKTTPQNCADCGASGQQVCPRCEGTKFIPVALGAKSSAAAPLPGTKSPLEYLEWFDTEVARLETGVKELGEKKAQLAERLEKAKSDRASFRDTMGAKQALSKMGEPVNALWKEIEIRAARNAEADEKVQKAKSSAENLVQESLLKEPKALRAVEARGRPILDELERSTEELNSGLKKLDKLLADWAEGSQDVVERVKRDEQARRKKEVTDRAIEAVKATVLRLAQQLQLSKPDAASGASEAGGVRVSIVLRDGTVPRDEDPDAVTVDESITTRIPDLLTQAFDTEPGLSVLEISIQGEYLDKYGLEAWRDVKKFRADREAWMKLRTGVYRGDPAQLLARVTLAPGGVGTPSAGRNANYMAVVILIGGLFAALCVAAVARMVMVR